MQIAITYYRNMTRWDVKYFASSSYFADDLTALKEFLIPRDEKFKKEDYLGNLDIVEKIAFNNGMIYFRKERKTGMDLFRGYKGDLLTSKINVHQGAIAICPQDLVCSTHYYLYQINDKKIIPEYLILALRSITFLKKVIKLKASSIKNEIGPKIFLNFKIYTPTLNVQKEVVSTWRGWQDKAQKLIGEADEKENAIDDYVLQEIGVKKKEYKKKNGVFLAHFKDLDRWGVNFNSYDWNLDNLFQSYKYKGEYLCRVAAINKTYHFSKNDLKKDVSFVPMESVSEIDGEIKTPKNRKLDGIEKGFTRFADGDIIFAKITPCMENGKCAIAFNLANGIGIGSTEFHVLSPNSDLIDAKYLWSLLRLKVFRKAAVRYFIGSAGQQRVPVNFLEEINIPLPPLPKQKEIAKRVESIRSEITKIKSKANGILEKMKVETEKKLTAPKPANMEGRDTSRS